MKGKQCILDAIFPKQITNEEIWGTYTNRISCHFHGKVHITWDEEVVFIEHSAFGTMLALEDMYRERLQRI